MSQTAVLELLRDLGGTATSGQIRTAAREKYPADSLSTYVVKRLRKLQIHGMVERTVINDPITHRKTSYWKLIE